jgi:enoyl-CoA hydratase/carnithine racemase
MPAHNNGSVGSGGGWVEAELRDGVLSLRLTNPSRANALDEPLLERLAAAMRAEGARVALLGGAGERHFSAGLDLALRGPDGLREGERALGQAVLALRAFPGPVIGVVNGDAFGGGLELAMACDWRLARHGARFAMTAARLGVVYTPQGLRAFAEAVGLPRARELFLTGRAVEADEALRIGLVDRVVDGPDLWPLALATAREVAANAPIAVAGTTALLRHLDDAELAARWRERAFASADLGEGLAAFREKRTPRFYGR